MADALEALDEMNSRVAALTTVVMSGRSKYASPSDIQPIARALAKAYFEGVRTELNAVKIRSGLVDEIDSVVQSILELASSFREKQSYVGQLNEIRPYLLEATIDLMKARGSPRLILSDVEKKILDTLSAMLPGSALSYEQALRDLQGVRVSWRGTATELREVLRDVMDHLAPDDKVMSAEGFQLEAKMSGPTQRQKVRFILRARRSTSGAVAVAEGSLARVDEAVASLARSTYQRGATATHVSMNATEVRNLKRYVDAVLAELLVIS